MPEFIEDVLEELKAIVLDEWDDILPYGESSYFPAYVGQVMKILDMFNENIVDDLSNTLRPPYVLVQAGKQHPDHTYGFGRHYRCHVSLWLMDLIQNRTDDQANPFWMDHYLQALNDRVFRSQATSFMATEMAQVDVSENNEANVLFLDAGYPIIGGVIEWAPGLLSGDSRPGEITPGI